MYVVSILILAYEKGYWYTFLIICPFCERKQLSLNCETKRVFSLTLLDSERPKLRTVSECNSVKERIFFIQSSVHVQTTFTSNQGGDHMVFISICRKEKWQCFVEGIIVYVKINNIISLSNNLH